MTPRDWVDLEREIDQALEALPGPRAPGTLLPRVLAAARDQVAPMPRWRPWYAWSPLTQAALLVAAVAVLGWGYWLWMAVDPLTALLPTPVQQAGRRADAVASTAGDLWRAGVLVWNAVVAPIVTTLFTFTLALCAACALVAAALGRLALGGAHQS